MTNQEIIEEIREFGYPTCLLDSEIEAAIRWVVRQIKFDYPVMAYGYFPLVAGQRIYDLFNPVLFTETSQGLFPEGLRVYEVLLPGDDFGTDGGVFGVAPGLQGWPWGGLPGFPGNWSFNTPGDWLIWDADLAAAFHRFRPSNFEQVTDLNAAPLRLFECPDASCPAFIRFTRWRTEAEIRKEDDSWFWTLVEARCCDTLANRFYLGAGVSFGELIRDDGRTAAHYEKEAQRKLAEGWAIYEAHKNEAISPAQRSHGP